MLICRINIYRMLELQNLLDFSDANDSVSPIQQVRSICVVHWVGFMIQRQKRFGYWLAEFMCPISVLSSAFLKNESVLTSCYAWFLQGHRTYLSLGYNLSEW
jgi:hypothetical protein